MSAIYDDSTDPSRRPLTPPRNRGLDTRTGGDAVAARIRHQSRWVELLVQHTVERWQGRRAASRARVAPAPRPGRSRPRWWSRRDDR